MTAPSKYDPSLMSLAKDVGAKLHLYAQDNVDLIASWLVESGINTGRDILWIVAQYRATH